MHTIRPFWPKGSTVNVAVTTSTQRVAITGPAIGTQSVRVANVGTDVIFITLGTVTTNAALATSMPLLPNSAETFNVQNDITHVAVIGVTGGVSTMYVTTGESA